MKTLGIVGCVLAALVVGILLTMTFAPVKTVEKVISVPVMNSYNDSAINVKLDALSAEVLKDSNWKSDAEALATAEFSEKSYKDLFNGMVDKGVAIDDKADISSVTIKESDVTSFDVDDKDAKVVQELKIYYEDSDGDDKKVYIEVTTTIVDGEVTKQKFVIV